MTGDIRNFRDDFDGYSRKLRDKPALIEAQSDRIYTYGEVADLIPRYRTFFENAGAKPGSTIVAILPNSVEMLLCFLTTVYYGYRFAPLSPDSPSSEISRWLSLTKPVLALCGDMLPDSSKAALHEGCPLEEMNLDGNLEFLPNAGSFASDSAPRSQLLMSTSGTTGEPKAMVMDTNVLWSSGYAFMDFHEFVDHDCRFLNILPMSYLGGLFNLGLIPLAKGGSVVIDEAFSGRSFFKFWNTVERFEVNVLWLVPSIVRGLLTLAKRAKPDDGSQSAIRGCFIGTAPISLDDKNEFEKIFGIPILENFALSETTFFTSETLGSRHRRVAQSTGEPLPYAELRFEPVSDEQFEGSESAREILVKSPYLFEGYIYPSGEIDRAIDEDGFFRTGDLGMLDDNERLVILGRSRDIIKKGGYFVPLTAVEQLAQKHQGVAEAAAVAVEHAFFGESFDIFIRPDGDLPENWISNVFAPWLHANLAKHMWPERIVLIEEFPRTASGKIRKHLLNDKAAEAIS
jgi:acyl-CoA synthetase (AMP-forming)/AMP-acid ligase II